MKDSAEAVLKETINERLKQPARVANYDYVKVLLLYWDGSSPGSLGFRDEGRAVGNFFREHYKFPFQEFAIPIDLPELHLKTQLMQEIAAASNATYRSRTPSLLIIHYGGHGTNDDNGAVWTAFAEKQENEPFVHWNKIQETLYDSESDILLVLDCCSSAHAGRARSKSSRIELLAAAAKDEKTPATTDKSFTTALINLLKQSIKTEDHITVETLHSRLSKLETKLLTTPVTVALREGWSGRSIRLAPLGSTVTPSTQPSPYGSDIRLLIRTAEFNQESVDELICWLRSDLPDDFSLEVESIINRTATIEGLVHSIPQQDAPLMRSLGSHTLEDILATWSTISDRLSWYKYQKANLRNDGPSQQQAVGFLEQLKSQSADIVDTVEQGILQSSSISDAGKLDEVLKDPATASLGILDQLRLRQIVWSSSHEHSETLRENSATPQANNSTSWEESKKYGKYLDPAHLPEVEARVTHLAELLNASKSPAFRSLKCSSWYHDRSGDRFVLRFELPDEFKSGQGLPLKKIIKTATGSRRPSLGDRFHMAFCLAKAVRQWHSVGWVHQSISGHNVILFERGNNEIAYNSPFLQGFDFARPDATPSLLSYVDDISQNVYRHPDRQGLSRKGHKKIHDLYSLGVLLLEIGLWEDVSVTSNPKKEAKLAVERMRYNLQAAATNRLAHYAGKDFQEAVLACLRSDFGIQEDNDEGSRLLKAFHDRVLDKLSKGSILR